MVCRLAIAHVIGRVKTVSLVHWVLSLGVAVTS